MESKHSEENFITEPDTTLALVLTSAEVSSSGLLQSYVSNKDFMEDFNSNTFHWVYHNETQRRVLVTQYIQDEKDNEDQKRRKARSLGAKLLVELQARKSNKVEIRISSNLGKTLVGILMNSFVLSNFKFNLKEENTRDSPADDFHTHLKIRNYKFVYEGRSDFTNDQELNFWIELAESTLYARTLANTRGSTAKPCYMEQQVRRLLEGHQEVTNLTVIKGKELEEKGFGLFYGVGKAANSEPRCVVVEYIGNPDKKGIDIAFIGKGITYDTGGLNIKGTGSMEDMYTDKSGACNVLGALRGALNLRIRKNAVFALALAENAVDKESQLPRDIVKSLKGLTVEIGNTDAEGRLVLADTMTYVQQTFKPEQLVDIATLTGAVRIALGNETAGLFANNDEFAQNIKRHADEVFEPTWQLPITQEARDNMKGDEADLNNMGKGSFGGSIKAAAFLERFVENGTKWVHLDIAGSNDHKSPKLPICSGANGFGTMSFINYLYKNQN